MRESLPDGALHLFPALFGGAAILSLPLLRWIAYHAADFDIIHVHGLFNPVSSLSARIAARRGRPLVIRPFGTLSRFTFEHRRSGLKRLYFSGLDRRNLERAGAIHFTTDGERQNAAWHALQHPERQHVVPPPLVGSMTGRKEVPCGIGAPSILLLGRLHPVKAVETLLAAWPAIAAAHSTVQLLIAGDGDPGYVALLRSIAAALPASDRIRFTGFVDGDAKRHLLASATVFVLPSYHENFGIAVLEAIASGLPVIVSSDVQLAPFIERHRLGHVVSRDAAPLAAGLLAALSDVRLQERCRTFGAGIVEQHFSTASVGEHLLEMYEAARTATIR